MKKTKKCGKCKAVMKTHVEYNGKKYNTQNRVYCFDCSPPKNVALDVASNVALSATLQNKAEVEQTSDEAARLYFIFGPLRGEPRWIHGVDDLEERLPNCYKFCQECNLAYTYSIEMVKEKIRKKGTTLYDYVIRYCEGCYAKISDRIFAEKIATKISQTSSCRKCRLSRHTYVAYSSLERRRAIKDDKEYDMICLSCEDDHLNGYDMKADEEEDDIPVEF